MGVECFLSTPRVVTPLDGAPRYLDFDLAVKTTDSTVQNDAAPMDDPAAQRYSLLVRGKVSFSIGGWHLLSVSHSLPYLKRSRVTIAVDGTPALDQDLWYPQPNQYSYTPAESAAGHQAQPNRERSHSASGVVAGNNSQQPHAIPPQAPNPTFDDNVIFATPNFEVLVQSISIYPLVVPPTVLPLLAEGGPSMVKGGVITPPSNSNLARNKLNPASPSIPLANRVNPAAQAVVSLLKHCIMAFDPADATTLRSNLPMTGPSALPSMYGVVPDADDVLGPNAGLPGLTGVDCVLPGQGGGYGQPTSLIAGMVGAAAEALAVGGVGTGKNQASSPDPKLALTLDGNPATAYVRCHGNVEAVFSSASCISSILTLLHTAVGFMGGGGGSKRFMCGEADRQSSSLPSSTSPRHASKGNRAASVVVSKSGSITVAVPPSFSSLVAELQAQHSRHSLVALVANDCRLLSAILSVTAANLRGSARARDDALQSNLIFYLGSLVRRVLLLKEQAESESGPNISPTGSWSDCSSCGFNLFDDDHRKASPSLVPPAVISGIIDVLDACCGPIPLSTTVPSLATSPVPPASDFSGPQSSPVAIRRVSDLGLQAMRALFNDFDLWGSDVTAAARFLKAFADRYAIVDISYSYKIEESSPTGGGAAASAFSLPTGEGGNAQPTRQRRHTMMAARFGLGSCLRFTIGVGPFLDSIRLRFQFASSKQQSSSHVSSIRESVKHASDILCSMLIASLTDTRNITPGESDVFELVSALSECNLESVCAAAILNTFKFIIECDAFGPSLHARYGQALLASGFHDVVAPILLSRSMFAYSNGGASGGNSTTAAAAAAATSSESAKSGGSSSQSVSAAVTPKDFSSSALPWRPQWRIVLVVYLWLCSAAGDTGEKSAKLLGNLLLCAARTGSLLGCVDDELTNALFLGGPNSNTNRLRVVLPVLPALAVSLTALEMNLDVLTKFLATAGISIKSDFVAIRALLNSNSNSGSEDALQTLIKCVAELESLIDTQGTAVTTSHQLAACQDLVLDSCSSLICSAMKMGGGQSTKSWRAVYSTLSEIPLETSRRGILVRLASMAIQRSSKDQPWDVKLGAGMSRLCGLVEEKRLLSEGPLGRDELRLMSAVVEVMRVGREGMGWCQVMVGTAHDVTEQYQQTHALSNALLTTLQPCLRIALSCLPRLDYVRDGAVVKQALQEIQMSTHAASSGLAFAGARDVGLLVLASLRRAIIARAAVFDEVGTDEYKKLVSIVVAEMRQRHEIERIQQQAKRSNFEAETEAVESIILGGGGFDGEMRERGSSDGIMFPDAIIPTQIQSSGSTLLGWANYAGLGQSLEIAESHGSNVDAALKLLCAYLDVFDEVSGRETREEMVDLFASEASLDYPAVATGGRSSSKEKNPAVGMDIDAAFDAAMVSKFIDRSSIERTRVGNVRNELQPQRRKRGSAATAEYFDQFASEFFPSDAALGLYEWGVVDGGRDMYSRLAVVPVKSQFSRFVPKYLDHSFTLERSESGGSSQGSTPTFSSGGGKESASGGDDALMRSVEELGRTIARRASITIKDITVTGAAAPSPFEDDSADSSSSPAVGSSSEKDEVIDNYADLDSPSKGEGSGGEYDSTPSLMEHSCVPDGSHNWGPWEVKWENCLHVRAAGSRQCTVILTANHIVFHYQHNLFDGEQLAMEESKSRKLENAGFGITSSSADETENILDDPSNPKNQEYRSKANRYVVNDLVHIYLRRYRLRDSAIELFFVGGGGACDGKSNSVFLDFGPGRSGVATRDRAATILMKRAPRFCYKQWPGTSLRKVFLDHGDPTQMWRQGRMSNFDYLLHLNTLAGRSFNDICQYPVFPWVLSNYTSTTVPDLSDESNFRDLSLPMGALNKSRLAEFLERYESFQDAHIPPFMYGSHYSTSAGVVLHFLVRLHPFAGLHRQLQGGHFDVADRLFASVGRTWEMCTSALSEVKELTPEFYSNPEFLRNVNDFKFGRSQDGEKIDDVALPPWAEGSADKFIEVMRAALESDYASRMLPKWIDLIFGEKQQGPAAVEANNVFFYLTYYGSVDVAAIEDEALRSATELQIAHFGQCPQQIFKTAHPSKVGFEIVETQKPVSVDGGAAADAAAAAVLAAAAALDGGGGHGDGVVPSASAAGGGGSEAGSGRSSSRGTPEIAVAPIGSIYVPPPTPHPKLPLTLKTCLGVYKLKFPGASLTNPPFTNAPPSHCVHVKQPPPGPHHPLVNVRFCGSDRVLAIDAFGVYHSFGWQWRVAPKEKGGDGSDRVSVVSSDLGLRPQEDGKFVASYDSTSFKVLPRTPRKTLGVNHISKMFFGGCALVLSDGDGEGSLSIQFVEFARSPVVKSSVLLPSVHSRKISAISSAFDSISETEFFACGSIDGSISLWKFVQPAGVLSVRPTRNFRGHAGNPITAISINSGLRIIVSVSKNRCSTHSLVSGRILRSWRPPALLDAPTVFAETRAICVGNNGHIVVICSTELSGEGSGGRNILTLNLFSLSGVLLGSQVLEPSRKMPQSIEISADSGVVFVGGGGCLSVHRLSAYLPLEVLDEMRVEDNMGLCLEVCCCDIGPEKKASAAGSSVACVVGCDDGSIRIHALPGIGPWSATVKKGVGGALQAAGILPIKVLGDVGKSLFGGIGGIGKDLLGIAKDITTEIQSGAAEIRNEVNAVEGVGGVVDVVKGLGSWFKGGSKKK